MNMNYALRFNHAYTRVSCVLCDQTFKSPIGYAVTLVEDNKEFHFLCDECARREEPVLRALVGVATEMHWMWASLSARS